MYDFSQHTYNGEAVAYAALPNYLLDLIDADASLTPTAKLIYLRLLRYAAYKKQTTFIITMAWLSERLQLNRKTVAAGLSLLKTHGYLTDEGIVIPAPATISTGARQAPCSHNSKQAKVTLAAIHTNPQPSIKESATTNTTAIDPSLVQNLLASVGSVKKVKTPTTGANNDNQRPNLTTADVQNLPITDHAKGKKVASDVQNLPIQCPKNGHSILTIPNNNQENNNQRPSAGLLPCCASSRTVECKQPSVTVQHRKSGIAQSAAQLLGTGKTNLPYKTQAYIESALIRMKASTVERERYLDEISYSINKGAFASNRNPLKAVRACLNLIERGQWKPPAGMY
jgi:hypothetical protein